MPVLYQSANNEEIEIPELTVDPVSPEQESAWVLHTSLPGLTGTPIGLLLSLTHSIPTSELYQLSYFTLENTIVRTVLS